MYLHFIWFFSHWNDTDSWDHGKQGLPVLHSWYYGCWWPGDSRSQDISNCNINITPTSHPNWQSTLWCHTASDILINIRSGNGLSCTMSTVSCPVNTSTNVELLTIGPLEMNFSEIWIKGQTFLFTKIYLKMLSAKWWPFWPGPMFSQDVKHCSR